MKKLLSSSLIIMFSALLVGCASTEERDAFIAEKTQLEKEIRSADSLEDLSKFDLNQIKAYDLNKVYKGRQHRLTAIEDHNDKLKSFTNVDDLEKYYHSIPSDEISASVKMTFLDKEKEIILDDEMDDYHSTQN